MRKKMRGLILCGLFISSAAFGQSPITDANWVSMPGINTIVYALAVGKSGKLYAGGSFDRAGGVIVNYVACWDGFVWSALGSGTNGSPPSGCVQSLVVDNSGNLYAGGSFDTAGGIMANHIAKWNGKAWSAMGSGTNGLVTTLAVDDSGNLYAGGRFDTAGGVKVNHIARWNGSSWSALGSGIVYPTNYVMAIAVDDSGILYLSDGELVYSWNHGKWDTIGLVGGNSSIYTLIVNKSNMLFVGGSFRVISHSSSFASAINIAIWNGTSWSGLEAGGVWTGVPPTSVSALAFDSSGNLYAGGNFFSIDGIGANYIVRWNSASGWSPLGSGFGGVPNVDAIVIDNSNNLYVGGYFWEWGVGGKPATNIARCALNGVSVKTPLNNTHKPVESPGINGSKLHFTLSHQSSVQFRVMDISGRELLRYNAMLGLGRHSINIGGYDLCPGVYILDFRAGDVSYKEKFSITR